MNGRDWEDVEKNYEKDLAPDTRALCDGYAAGINAFAARHPERAIAALYPVRGEDVVAGFVHKLPLFFGMDRTLRSILEPQAKPDNTVSRVERASRLSSVWRDFPDELHGSNVIAVAPRRSSDGATRIAINSHQPWEGPVAWYEAHLHSETGWDMVGGLFPGTPLILHGHNRDLGWAHTVNRPDLIDVYALELDPQNPNRYRFDGAWRELERRSARIEVKLVGPLHWTVERETLWSVHGPVLRGPRGSFAIRYAGMGDVRAVEQWYRMNRARSFEEWLAAMRLQGVPMFNSGYADRRGRIAYLYGARIPARDEAFDWSGTLPGDTSRALWSAYVPFERMPIVVDPPSAFIQNANSSPFQTTLGAGNPSPADFPKSYGIETRMTNRALRALELFGHAAAIPQPAFDDYKFDVTYSTDSVVAQRWRALLSRPAPTDALTARALALLRGWNLGAEPDNRITALAILTLRPNEFGGVEAADPALLQRRLRDAARELEWTFGRIDPPWAEVNRLRRGAVDIGMGGAPDVLHAVYGRRDPDGRLRGTAGDSYILMVEWDKQGRVSSRSVNTYGSVTRDARSPHYADQAPLFAGERLKPVWLEEKDIRAHLEREYRPGALR